MTSNASPLPPRGAKPRIVIDSALYPRLLALAEQARKAMPALADQLLEEVERADLRASEDMPADVVTIGSEVTFRDGEKTQTVRIVLPREADLAQSRVSLLTPVGAALIGLRAGQRIGWEMADGRLKVLEVLEVLPPEP